MGRLTRTRRDQLCLRKHAINVRTVVRALMSIYFLSANGRRRSGSAGLFIQSDAQDAVAKTFKGYERICSVARHDRCFFEGEEFIRSRRSSLFDRHSVGDLDIGL